MQTDTASLLGAYVSSRVTQSRVSTLRAWESHHTEELPSTTRKRPFEMFQIKFTEITAHLDSICRVTYRKIITAKMFKPEIHKGLQIVISVVNFVEIKPVKYGRKCIISHHKIGERWWKSLFFYKDLHGLVCGKLFKIIVKFTDELHLFFNKVTGVPSLHLIRLLKSKVTF